MHELSSSERNARYRRFFELLNNPPGLYQVILNLFSVSYHKICSAMHQLHSRKVSDKQLLIVVNCLFRKYHFLYFLSFDVVMLFYNSLPS
jgi:hypothetical protein